MIRRSADDCYNQALTPIEKLTNIKSSVNQTNKKPDENKDSGNRGTNK